MKLRKVTVEDLENKCSDVKDLLENDLTYIDNIFFKNYWNILMKKRD